MARVLLESFDIKGKKLVSIFEKRVQIEIEGVDKIVVDEFMVPRYEDLTETQRSNMFNGGVIERELLFRSFEQRLKKIEIRTDSEQLDLDD
ncbi:MAG: hypothetical protein WCI60_01880 [bacterium]